MNEWMDGWMDGWNISLTTGTDLTAIVRGKVILCQNFESYEKHKTNKQNKRTKEKRIEKSQYHTHRENKSKGGRI